MYSEMQKHEIWLATIPGIGATHYFELVEHFGSAQAVFNEYRAGSYPLGEKTEAALIKARSPQRVDALAQRLEQRGLQALTFSHPHYPEILKSIDDPPCLLYAIGDTSLLGKPSIAMVGSRRATRYGKEMAFELAQDLAATGAVIVSGMARGIDSCSHRGALAAEGKTIAVLGCGVDVVYPPENQELYDEIAKKGLLISEYLPGAEPLGNHFPARNRIISGLSTAVILVEAGERSGALHTLNFALEQGREVFALPGNINSPNSAGTNRMIRDGAHMLLEFTDVLDELGWSYTPKAPEAAKSSGDHPHPATNPEEKQVLALLESGEFNREELAAQVDCSAQKLNTTLTMLELRGIIKQSSGGIYHL